MAEDERVKRLQNVIKQLEKQLESSTESYELLCRNLNATLEAKDAELADLRSQLEVLKSDVYSRRIHDLQEAPTTQSMLPGTPSASPSGHGDTKLEDAILELQGRVRLLEQALALKEKQLSDYEEEKRQNALLIFEERLQKEEARRRADELENEVNVLNATTHILQTSFEEATEEKSLLSEEVSKLKQDLDAALLDLEAFGDIAAENLHLLRAVDNVCHVKLCSSELADWITIMSSQDFRDHFSRLDSEIVMRNFQKSLMAKKSEDETLDESCICNACSEQVRRFFEHYVDSMNNRNHDINHQDDVSRVSERQRGVDSDIQVK
jgi:DNA repair exonuclease SbcCD ATPase subunit